MKNALNYYYNLYPSSIHQVNKDFRCYLNDSEYVLIMYDKDPVNIEIIYEMSNQLLQNNIPCHQIILNRNNEIITLINNEPYILLRVYINNRAININDVLFFSNLIVNGKEFEKLYKTNWYQMWVRKIDYIEYQVSQIGKKFPLIRESINYYIGMAENSISLLSNFNYTSYIDRDLVVSHNRIKNGDNLIDLYNPLNFIVDSKVRDLSEYIKHKFFFENYYIDEIIEDINKFNLNHSQLQLLFIRLLFPSYFFDVYEKIIAELVNENELIKIFNKNDSYIKFLKQLYFEIKKITNIPELEWIIKT